MPKIKPKEKTKTDDLSFIDFIKSIQNKNYILTPENQNKYLKFLVNNVVAGEPSLVSIANFVLNINSPNFSNKMHYDFLFYSEILKKGKFYAYKYKNVSPEDETISEFFQENINKVKDYKFFMSEEEIKTIEKQYQTVRGKK